MDIFEQIDRLNELEGKRVRIAQEIKTLSEKMGDGDNAPGVKTRIGNLSIAMDRVEQEITQTRRVDPAALDGIEGESGSEPGAGKSRAAGVGTSKAMRILDGHVKSGGLPDHAAAKTEHLIKRAGTEAGRTLAARWVDAAGDPEYMGAFCKLMGDPERGHLLWTGPEHEAYRKVAKLRAEMKAMSLTDANGGFMVPLTLDPAILLTSDGSINPLRRISRVVQTVTDQWQGVSSAGATAEWKAEAAEMADASPTLGDEPIGVHFGDAYVPFSFEVGMDAVNFTSELQMVLVDAADQLMNTAYTTGTGSGQPTGIVTALVGTASEINGTGTEALDDSDPYALQNALPARFSARAAFLSHIATANTYRAMETTNGAHAFPELRQTPPMLLGKPWYENSNMDGAINPAATANNYVLLYGDFRHFVIVDRIGTTLEIMQHVIGANRRPTGQRGAILWFRTGSNVVVPNAFRMLDVPTTA